MAALIANILESHDPKVKLVMAFLEQVLHVERKDIRELLIAETHESQMRSPSGSRSHGTDWNASVTLGTRPVQVDMSMSNSRGPYSVESIVFRGGWQG